MHFFKLFVGVLRPVFPLKVVCRKIGPALWKIGSTDFVRMSKKDAFSWQFSQFLAKANDFGTRTPPILSNLIKLAQAQKPEKEHWLWLLGL